MRPKFVLEPENLQRFPLTKNPTLRAWDAADEYVIDFLAGQPVDLVVNDAFGALAVALSPAMSLTDSVTAQVATELNLERNGRPPVAFMTPLDPLDTSWLNTVVIKIPKTLSLLEHELHQIRPLLSEDSVVVGAGMVKHVHTSTLETFERVIGPTTTSLAKKKARLVHARFDRSLAPARPAPVRLQLDSGVTLVNLANVFSREKLDVGTRLLLDSLPTVPDGSDVVDLGCGNGAIGIVLARRFVGGSIQFSDVSHLAVASAAASYEATFGSVDRATFVARHILEGMVASSVDFVFDNPPFHDQQVVGDEVAWRMFVESRRVLRPGGELRVVGNRHLGYHTKLKRLFGNCETVSSNKKFVVLSARR